MRKEEIQKEIGLLLEGLRSLDREETAIEIERIWDMSVTEYSRSIHSYKSPLPMEPALKKAFDMELERLDHKKTEREAFISSLEKDRLIQNAHHLVPTIGPRLLSIDWQSTLALSPSSFYFVGMYSGVPFSNDWFPGKLIFGPKFKIEDVISADSPEYSKSAKDQNGATGKKADNEKRVTIIPSKMQNQLVYRSEMTKKTRNMVKALVPHLKKYFDHPAIDEIPYTKWAVLSCRNLLQDCLKKENLVYLDINEVVSKYLIEVLEDPKHILHKIFFDSDARNKFLRFLPNEKLFLTTYTTSDFPSQEAMNIQGNELVSKHSNIELKPEAVISALKEGKLCPGLLLCFTSLAFLNGFKCLGSFRQAVYLPQYKKKWLESGLLTKAQLDTVPACNITTGSFPDSHLSNIHPLDIVLGDKFDPDPNILYGEFLLSVKERFLE